MGEQVHPGDRAVEPVTSSSTAARALDTDVLVVGAGPVGLTAAALLAAYGVDVVVVERNAGTSDEPKAISIDDESLRTFAAAGLIDAVLPIITPGTGTRYYAADGGLLFQARAAIPFRLGFPFKNPFAQPDLEQALALATAARPQVRMRFRTAFTGVRQDDDGVCAELHDLEDDRRSQVRARYLLGCDGGRSTVRQQLGITMTGRGHTETWLVADTLHDPHTERFGMHHGDPDRPYVIIPGRGGRCRYEFLLRRGEGVAGGEVPFDLIKTLLAPHRDIAPEDVERVVNYQFNSLVADSWCAGGAFLLGDAAHMMPPFAGQGLNSGIRDAANLCWKLADVIHGRLSGAALSTYQTERKAHAAATVRLSGRLGSVVMSTNVRLAAHRDSVVRSAMQTLKGRTFFEEMRYRPHQSVAGGICVDDGSGSGQVLGQPRVFDTTAHRELMLDALTGNGWALLGVDVQEADWTHALPPPLAALRPQPVTINVGDFLPPDTDDRPTGVDVDGSLERELAHLRGRFVLVRPDRFIAASWVPGDDVHRVVEGLSPFLPRAEVKR